MACLFDDLVREQQNESGIVAPALQATAVFDWRFAKSICEQAGGPRFEILPSHSLPPVGMMNADQMRCIRHFSIWVDLILLIAKMQP
jgi:hypothetical protein